jgi:hypothetical protein
MCGALLIGKRRHTSYHVGWSTTRVDHATLAWMCGNFRMGATVRCGADGKGTTQPVKWDGG